MSRGPKETLTGTGPSVSKGTEKDSHPGTKDPETIIGTKGKTSVDVTYEVTATGALLRLSSTQNTELFLLTEGDGPTHTTRHSRPRDLTTKISVLPGPCQGLTPPYSRWSTDSIVLTLSDESRVKRSSFLQTTVYWTHGPRPTTHYRTHDSRPTGGPTTLNPLLDPRPSNPRPRPTSLYAEGQVGIVPESHTETTQEKEETRSQMNI